MDIPADAEQTTVPLAEAVYILLCLAFSRWHVKQLREKRARVSAHVQKEQVCQSITVSSQTDSCVQWHRFLTSHPVPFLREIEELFSVLRQRTPNGSGIHFARM